jgi:hypothetical protein
MITYKTEIRSPLPVATQRFKKPPKFYFQHNWHRHYDNQDQLNVTSTTTWLLSQLVGYEQKPSEFIVQKRPGLVLTVLQRIWRWCSYGT